MAADVETIVVGAGVVGLAIARSRRARPRGPGLERHDRIGAETSSRSSEVIHAGLYYPPGSLRAKACVAGKEMLYRFAAEAGVAVNCGKLLVATQQAELPRLAAIAETAARNGVADLVELTGAEARAGARARLRGGAAVALDRGRRQPRAHDRARRRDRGARRDGGAQHGGRRHDARPRRHVRARDGGRRAGAHHAPRALAAGLGATALARLFAWPAPYAPPETWPAKGHYFALSGRAPFRRLVYPMPDGAWLGVHLTLDVSGRARFGPDLEWTDRVSYDFEDADGARRARFAAEICRYWPGLPECAAPGRRASGRSSIAPASRCRTSSSTGRRRTAWPAWWRSTGSRARGLTASLAVGEWWRGWWGRERPRAGCILQSSKPIRD